MNVLRFSPCFSVEPSKGILEEEETMQLTANFLSEKSGEFKANLFLNYELGIDKQLTVQKRENIDVKLNSNFIVILCVNKINFCMKKHEFIVTQYKCNAYKLLTGEKLCLTLRSLAINCTIRIDRGSVRMENTYLGLSRSKLLTIHNRSDYVVRFQWMCFRDKKADIQRKEE